MFAQPKMSEDKNKGEQSSDNGAWLKYAAAAVVVGGVGYALYKRAKGSSSVDDETEGRRKKEEEFGEIVTEM